jgi:hypothetical protein
VTILEADTDLADGIYEATVEFTGMVRQPAGPLVAAAFPVRPPGAWFQNPGFSKLEPLTIQSDGRVHGHVASWRDDHIGMNGHVRAPKSKSGYAFFATGVLETAEGNMVNVGQITLTGGHAPLEASVSEAVAHYDNTDSAIMDVAVGEDRHGIWVAGALRPTVDENQLRAIRASSVSGDWRPINGGLEMVAVCAVNVPGFPIPRARVASGVPVALVAAGTGELVDLMVHQDDGAEQVVAAAFDDRLRFIEDVLLGKIGDSRAVLAAAIAEARGEPITDDDDMPVEDRLLALRARAHPERQTPDLEAEIPVAAPTADLDALRARVRGDAPAIDIVAEVIDVIETPTETTAVPEPPEALAAALRAKVHPVTAAGLRERVHGGDAVPFVEGSPLAAAALTDDVWDDGMPYDYSTDECLQASLRARAKGGVTATATKAWTADKRKKAANRGAAMPGGRFPISDCKDVTKAVHALGRAKGDKSKVRSHIKRRAKSLGCTGNIPDDWK